MKDQKLDDEIKALYGSLSNKRGILQTLRAEKYRYLSDYLSQRFETLADKRYSPGMKIWWIVNGIEDFPPCAECGKPNRTDRCSVSGYQTEYCSAKCSHGSVAEKKREATNMAVYGCANPKQSKAVQDKCVERLRDKYGVDNVWQLDSVKEKSRGTKEERYGDAGYVNAEKRAATNLERYGAENAFASEEIKGRIRETMLERYGADHPMRVDEIRDKVALKSRERQVHNSWKNFVSVNTYSAPAFDEDFYYAHREKDFEFDFKCRKCGKVFQSRVHNGGIRRCPACYPVKTTSIKEAEMYEFLKSVYGGKIVRKDRTILKGSELDFVIPDRKLAIEFDGLYWHSEQFGGKDRNYHVDKTDACEREGMALVHVFEDEWDGRREIVESRIKDMLGVRGRTVYARSCEVREIGNSESADFMDENHLQGGSAQPKLSYGLFKDGELLAAMSFCGNRIALGHSSSDGWELLRFCCKTGCHIPGAAGKLLAKFEADAEPESLISYADRRWSRGNLYEKLGFRLDHVSRPNYWYLNNGCYARYHRFAFRKSELAKKLKKFDPDLTEIENMVANKYSRIWDCGNLVYVKEYPRRPR